ncbi:MAG TPA: hypothetical protein PLQ59_03800 [Fervidobacterium sp.]|nr:hypothetical protein [Fervidobacterium sp.]HQO06019.1 hypothetical protein [Fervidobacterium sp.]HQQ16999.1 hypothetical protein [Fervidobacterium sp.]
MTKLLRPAEGEQLVAYTDGSFKDGIYVYAFTLNVQEGSSLIPVFISVGECTIFSGHNNVSCELEACYRAVQTAQKLGAKCVSVYTDFHGCFKFLTHEWGVRNKQFLMYVNLMSGLSIPFTIQYVPAHRGFKGNNEVDRLAKREANRLLEESSRNVASNSAGAFAEKIIDAQTV